MRHGTTVRVMENGTKISKARLKTIGIYHDSISWGIWLPSDDEDLAQHPDLLICAINPASWPYTFRLTLRLRNTIGSMAAAAEALQALGVNILSARSSVSGHHHATWNLIGEALPLRQDFEAEGYLFKADRDRHRNQETAKEIAARLLSFLDDLVETLKDAEFLHERFRNQQLMSFDKEDLPQELWNNKALWERIGDQRSKAVACSIMPVLTFLWREGVTNLRNGDNGLDPLEFQYDRESELLKCRRPEERFSTDLRRLGIETPGIAVASFDTDEHYLRLRCFKEQERRKLFHIDINYTQYFAEKRSSTQGMIKDVTDNIAQRQINLVQVSNSVSDQNPREETGGLRFIVELQDPPTVEEVDVLRTKLKDDVDHISEGLHTKVKLLPVSIGRIFLSRHLDQERKEPMEAIEELAHTVGLEVVDARTLVSGVTSNTLEVLHTCHGLVQIYGRREDERKKDLQWLIGEYAAAKALGLPAVRIVDVAMKEAEDWRNFFRWDRDAQLVTYDSRWSPEKIKTNLKSQLPIFLETVISRLRLQRSAG